MPEALLGIDTLTGNPAGSTTSWNPIENCHVSPPWSAGTQAKFLVVYPLPWDLQVSAVYQNVPGLLITTTYPASNAQISPSLGRNLGSCRGAATCSANVNIELIAPGVRYEDRLQQVDLRFTRSFGIQRFKVRANADVANLFNKGNVYQNNTGYGSQWLVPYEIMGGRLLRVGGQLDF